MPDSNALIASLLLQQKQREDPFQAQRKFGESQMLAGASTAPINSGSPWEGVARALQGGVGGYFAHQADQDEQTQDQNNIGIMGKMATATTSQEIAAAARGLKGGNILPILGQIAQGHLDQTLKQEQAGAQYAALTGGQPQQGAGPMPPAAPPTGPIAAPPSPNNVGNISDGRGGFQQYPTPQAGAADAASLLKSYPVQYNNGQPMTLNQIALKYNPPDDGKNPQLKGNNPAQWAQNVAKASGLDPNQPLDFDNPAVLSAVVRGINPSEKAPADRQAAPVLNQGVQQAIDPRGPQQAPLSQGAPQGPPQPQTPQQSPAGNMFRQQAAQAHAQGQNDQALAFAQKAIEADATYAQDVAKRDVPGTPAGDVALLQSGMHDPRVVQTPEYAAAHARVGKPQMAQGGQMYFPDMTAYPTPAGGAAPTAGGRFVDTPDSQFKMANDYAKQFSEDPAVKNYRALEPVITTMRDAATRNTKSADTNLLVGLATLYNNGQGVPRGEVLNKIAEVGSIPEEIRTKLQGAIAGQGMGPEERKRVMDEAESIVAARKQQYDSTAAQYGERGKQFGLRPQDFMTTPASAQEPQQRQEGAKVRTYNPATGRLE